MLHWHLGCYAVELTSSEPSLRFHKSCTRCHRSICHQHPSHLHKRRNHSRHASSQGLDCQIYPKWYAFMLHATLGTISLKVPTCRHCPCSFEAIFHHPFLWSSQWVVVSMFIKTSGRNQQKELSCAVQLKQAALKDLYTTSACPPTEHLGSHNSRNKVRCHPLIFAIQQKSRPLCPGPSTSWQMPDSSWVEKGMRKEKDMYRSG